MGMADWLPVLCMCSNYNIEDLTIPFNSHLVAPIPHIPITFLIILLVRMYHFVYQLDAGQNAAVEYSYKFNFYSI